MKKRLLINVVLVALFSLLLGAVVHAEEICIPNPSDGYAWRIASKGVPFPSETYAEILTKKSPTSCYGCGGTGSGKTDCICITTSSAKLGYYFQIANGDTIFVPYTQ